MKLRNQEIYLAYTNLLELAKMPLPVKTSLGVASLISKLRQPYMVIEGERQKLVRKYGKLDPQTKQITVDLDGENAGDFAREYGEILIEEWEDDLIFKKVVLPLSVFTTCEQCKHKIEISFVIEPNTLLPLRDKFVEIKES